MHRHQYIGKIITRNGNKATADRIVDYIPGQWVTGARSEERRVGSRYVGYDYGHGEHKWCDLTGIEPMVANKIFSEDRMKYKAIENYFDGMGMGLHGEYRV